MKTKRLKRVSLAVVCILVVSVICISLLSNGTKVNAYEQIKAAFDEVESQVEKSMDFDGKYYINGLPLALSSNPYDYVANNAEYDKLISMGADAVSVIADCLGDTENYSGLDRYILAIALEDIMKIDLKNYAQYAWEDGDSFLKSWQQINEDVVNEIPRILADASLTAEEKWSEVAKFGTLAIEPLQAAQESRSAVDSELATKMINLLSTSDKGTIVKIATSELNAPN